MGVINSEISCTVEVPKGYIYFRYQFFEGRSSSLEFEASSEDLLCLGRTAGKRYSFIPNTGGVYIDTVGTHLEEVLNYEAMQGIRDSAQDLPDKLRAAIGL